MTSVDLYWLISNAVAVVTAEIIQIRRGKEKTPVKWKVANSGESMSPILPMIFSSEMLARHPLVSPFSSS